MSWKAEVTTYDDDTWTSNALRFATREEAQAYVHDLKMRWMSVVETRVVVSDEPVNYAWSAERGLHRLTNEETA